MHTQAHTEMMPLPKHVKITHISWHNISVQLTDDENGSGSSGSGSSRNNRQRQEILHYQTLHRGRTLLSAVEGEVRSGEVRLSEGRG